MKNNEKYQTEATVFNPLQLIKLCDDLFEFIGTGDFRDTTISQGPDDKLSDVMDYELSLRERFEEIKKAI